MGITAELPYLELMDMKAIVNRILALLGLCGFLNAALQVLDGNSTVRSMKYSAAVPEQFIFYTNNHRLRCLRLQIAILDPGRERMTT